MKFKIVSFLPDKVVADVDLDINSWDEVIEWDVKKDNLYITTSNDNYDDDKIELNSFFHNDYDIEECLSFKYPQKVMVYNESNELVDEYSD